jgi:ferritin
MLQWFVSEQVEEEDSVRKILEKLEKIENFPVALYALDTQLGKRGNA